MYPHKPRPKSPALNFVQNVQFSKIQVPFNLKMGNKTINTLGLAGKVALMFLNLVKILTIDKSGITLDPRSHPLNKGDGTGGGGLGRDGKAVQLMGTGRGGGGHRCVLGVERRVCPACHHPLLTALAQP